MKTIRWCSGAALGLLLFGCGAADLDPIEVEASVGTAEEAEEELQKPHFYRVYGNGFAECHDFDYLLGTAGFSITNAGLTRIVPRGGIPVELEVEAWGGTQVTAEGVCSEALGDMRFGQSLTGTQTVSCQDGQVAVGGGGFCHSGKLYRSRPDPDNDESEPHGWAVGCTSGPVDAYVICRDRENVFDFKNCKTQRKDSTGSATLVCPSNTKAISAGGYCGGNTPLTALNLHNTLTGAKVQCQSSSASVHAYVVCCG